MKKILFTLGIALALVSCSKGPESVAKKYVESMAKGNIDEAKGYMSKDANTLSSLLQIDNTTGSETKYPDYEFILVNDSTVDNKISFIKYIAPDGGEGLLTLHNENNEWKVLVDVKKVNYNDVANVAKHFILSIAKGDFNGAKAYSSTQTRAELDIALSVVGDNFPKYPDYQFKIIKDSIVGDSAWVTYINLLDKKDILILVKENNEWKVSMN